MKEVITSRQNPRVREVCGLTEKKKRREAGQFRFDGIKLFREALSRDLKLTSVFVREPASEATDALLRQAIEEGKLTEREIVWVSDSVFEKISEEKNPEGVLCVAKTLDGLHRRGRAEALAKRIGDEERLLIAESLRDPGNLGTVMRSCAALGIDCLILTEDCADLYNGKTVRSAMGALFRLQTLTVTEGELPALIGLLRERGRSVYAAALREDAREIGAFELTRGDCFVIGNEGHGLSEETIDACNGTAIIPMREGNESLNAAAAAAICVWETVRT
ncbi:MAG: RNA methyltransferase [Clostridia bacterium]|nr:RNA methyltransferase [Clostridia bacterium]